MGLSIDDVHPLDVEQFCLKIINGTPVLNAAFDMGWNDADLASLAESADFRHKVAYAEKLALGQVEEGLARKARTGHLASMRFFLVNRDPDRWQPEQRAVSAGDTLQVSHEVKVSISAGVLDMVREMGVRALQPGGVLDAIETTASDG